MKKPRRRHRDEIQPHDCPFGHAQRIADGPQKSVLRYLILAAVLFYEPPVQAAIEPSSAAASTVLGIDGSQFLLNGKPTFLLGISYYGALGAAEDFIRRDLTDPIWRNWRSASKPETERAGTWVTRV